MIFTRRGITIDDYPAIKTHLETYRARLEPRPNDWPEQKKWGGRKAGPYKWYEIQDNVAYYSAFAGPKIIWGNLGLAPAFSYNAGTLNAFAPANIIPVDDLYLLGVLNSDVSGRFFSDISIQRSGNYLEFKPMYVTQLPIPNAHAADRNAIADLVQRCLDARGVGCGEWEAEIDARVAVLYGVGP